MRNFNYQPQRQSLLLSLPLEILGEVLLLVLGDEKAPVKDISKVHESYTACLVLESIHYHIGKDLGHRGHKTNDLRSVFFACKQFHISMLACIRQHFAAGLRLKLEICATHKGNRGCPIWLSIPAVFRKIETFHINHHENVNYKSLEEDFEHARRPAAMLETVINHVLLVGPEQPLLNDWQDWRAEPIREGKRCVATVSKIVINFDLTFSAKCGPDSTRIVKEFVDFVSTDLEEAWTHFHDWRNDYLNLLECVGSIVFTINGRSFKTFSVAEVLRQSRPFDRPILQVGVCPFLSFWNWKKAVVVRRRDHGLPVDEADIGPTKTEIEKHRQRLMSESNCSDECTVAGWRLAMV